MKIDDMTEGKSPCWDGYEKVPGKKDYEKGSCRKKTTEDGRQTAGAAVKRSNAAYERNLRRAKAMMKKGFDAKTAARNHDVKVKDLEEANLKEYHDLHTFDWPNEDMQGHAINAIRHEFHPYDAIDHIASLASKEDWEWINDHREELYAMFSSYVYVSESKLDERFDVGANYVLTKSVHQIMQEVERALPDLQPYGIKSRVLHEIDKILYDSIIDLNQPSTRREHGLEEDQIDYDAFRGKGTERWVVTYSYGAGRGGQQTRTMGVVGIPQGSTEDDVKKRFTKRMKGKKFISAEKTGIVEKEGDNLGKGVKAFRKSAQNTDPRMIKYKLMLSGADFIEKIAADPTGKATLGDRAFAQMMKALGIPAEGKLQHRIAKKLVASGDYKKAVNLDKNLVAYSDNEIKDMYKRYIVDGESHVVTEKEGGMSDKERKAYNRKNGSNLKRAQPGGGKRRTSYCARSKGQMDMHNIDCRKDPDKPICKARRDWNC